MSSLRGKKERRSGTRNGAGSGRGKVGSGGNTKTPSDPTGTARTGSDELAELAALNHFLGKKAGLRHANSDVNISSHSHSGSGSHAHAHPSDGKGKGNENRIPSLLLLGSGSDSCGSLASPSASASAMKQEAQQRLLGGHACRKTRAVAVGGSSPTSAKAKQLQQSYQLQQGQAAAESAKPARASKVLKPGRRSGSRRDHKVKDKDITTSGRSASDSLRASPKSSKRIAIEAGAGAA